jgi:ABC-type multidrug transport system fused ATPase/permease subunit
MSDSSSAPVASRTGRPRMRRVTRVIRDIDVWSVFKVGLVFHLVLFVVALIAGTLLWSVANSTGTIDNVENFFESFGWESFSFDGSALFGNFVAFGLLAAILGMALWVVGAVMFNLITELVGGVRVTVLEEEVVLSTVVEAEMVELPPTPTRRNG